MTEDFSSGWDKVRNLNLKTPFFLTKALAAPLRAAATADRPGKVINIASIDGLRAAAEGFGMVSLRSAGLNFAFEGTTTLDEVVRETILEA